jgi:hypothetical protein
MAFDIWDGRELRGFVHRFLLTDMGIISSLRYAFGIQVASIPSGACMTVVDVLVHERSWRHGSPVLRNTDSILLPPRWFRVSCAPDRAVHVPLHGVFQL